MLTLTGTNRTPTATKRDTARQGQGVIEKKTFLGQSHCHNSRNCKFLWFWHKYLSENYAYFWKLAFPCPIRAVICNPNIENWKQIIRWGSTPPQSCKSWSTSSLKYTLIQEDIQRSIHLTLQMGLADRYEPDLPFISMHPSQHHSRLPYKTYPSFNSGRTV